MACGLSADLFLPGDGSGKRESYRQALFSVLLPLRRLVAAELSYKLGVDVRFDWAEMKATDIASRARALQSLVGSGMPLEKAMAISGLMVSDDA